MRSLRGERCYGATQSEWLASTERSYVDSAAAQRFERMRVAAGFAQVPTQVATAARWTARPSRPPSSAAGPRSSGPWPESTGKP
jgi:hypothetical protein